MKQETYECACDLSWTINKLKANVKSLRSASGDYSGYRVTVQGMPGSTEVDLAEGTVSPENLELIPAPTANELEASEAALATAVADLDRLQDTP